MSSNDTKLPDRQSNRLIGHNYAGHGAYFVTMCVAEMKPLLGIVHNGKMSNSPFGVIVTEEWQKSAELRPEIKLDEFIVMPNHFHAILWINSRPTSQKTIKAGTKTGSIGAVIAQFKAASTRRINALRGSSGATFWQRNYYDRVIRDEDELNQTRHYIRLNPYQWADDKYHR